MRFWCFELGDMDGYRKHQAEKLKNFLTNFNRHRQISTTEPIAIPRDRFWGTSNGMPLNNPTGSTRFVVIPVDTELPWRDVNLARESLLARAVQEYLNGAPYFSTADEMDAIRERNSDFQTVEPWFDAIRCKAEEIVGEDRLPVTTRALNKVVEIHGIKGQNPHNSERISNVMKALGFYYGQHHHEGKRPRGWWPLQVARPKRRF